MTNKIGPLDPGMVGKLAGRPAEAVAESKPASGHEAQVARSSRGTGADDTVALTGRAQLLERLEKALDSMSGVDDARVAQLRTAIENGEYELDSASIAQAMLRFERLLGD